MRQFCAMVFLMILNEGYENEAACIGQLWVTEAKVRLANDDVTVGDMEDAGDTSMTGIRVNTRSCSKPEKNRIYVFYVTAYRST